jgi:hypothetical protein
MQKNICKYFEKMCFLVNLKFLKNLKSEKKCLISNETFSFSQICEEDEKNIQYNRVLILDQIHCLKIFIFLLNIQHF